MSGLCPGYVYWIQYLSPGFPPHGDEDRIWLSPARNFGMMTAVAEEKSMSLRLQIAYITILGWDVRESMTKLRQNALLAGGPGRVVPNCIRALFLEVNQVQPRSAELGPLRGTDLWLGPAERMCGVCTLRKDRA